MQLRITMVSVGKNVVSSRGIVLLIILLAEWVTDVCGFKYFCHKDICNSTWQFCNYNDKRCNDCTFEQCSTEAAKAIRNQCEVFCREQGLTSSTSTRPLLITTTSTNALGSLQDQTVWTWQLIALVVGFPIVILILLIILYLVWRIWKTQRRTQCDPERGTLSKVSIDVSAHGSTEKEPLLPPKYPTKIDSQTSTTEQADNKFEEMHILRNGIESPQTMPPSYDSSPVESNPSQGAVGINQNPPGSKAAGSQETDNSMGKGSDNNPDFQIFKSLTNYNDHEGGVDLKQTRPKSPERPR